ncbi:MAG: HDIG domain-containing protein, partial [Victivallales bacterium]|nr:HDIG domain-containing protein [Victivallales bacterium]
MEQRILQTRIACPENTLAVIRRLQEAGHQAVLAGGCVRDALLGRTANDWDVATSALPDQVEALFEKTVAVGKQFGIIVVVLPDGSHCEVATFRGEGRYLDGRHPSEIRFVDMEEDVKRRDFTVNALLADPVSGEIYDFTGGLEDLKNGILRAVGEPSRRFEEDRLRVLRAIRFAASLGFQIHPDTVAAIAPALPFLKQCLSAERIAAETDKMLLCGNSQYAFRMLEETGILRVLFPELAACIGVQQPPQFHPEGDVWQHQLKLMGALDLIIRKCRRIDSPVPPEERQNHEGALAAAATEELRYLAWGALLHDIGKPPTFYQAADRIRFNGHDCVGAKMAKEVMTALKLPGALVENAVHLVLNHM